MIELIYNLVYSEDSVDYDFRIFFVSQFLNDKPTVPQDIGICAPSLGFSIPTCCIIRIFNPKNLQFNIRCKDKYLFLNL